MLSGRSHPIINAAISDLKGIVRPSQETCIGMLSNLALTFQSQCATVVGNGTTSHHTPFRRDTDRNDPNLALTFQYQCATALEI
jgi:hypothetical protein